MMILYRKGRTYTAALIVLIFVAIFNLLGSVGNLYYIIPWYDIPMHFIGGFWAAITAVWACTSKLKPRSFLGDFFVVLLVTFILAVIWEVFEFTTGITSLGTITVAGLPYWADTIKDIAMGMLGGVFAFVLDKIFVRPKNR